ncbi:hypothetical protein AYI69_g4581 [Smittium culicis]|uniref:CCHC-type domain-containing protein n=1 Tax=Smittium culicis TaxID=133412 RepID=A0A1R1YCC2_9FUNG|nr:hypothetical protein AYI69_g4581 [Smittium culicis]
MSDFNDRFNKYLATIPKEHYTSAWFAKSYLETVSFIDRDLWWLMAQDKKVNDVKNLMSEAVRLMKLKTGIDSTKDVSLTESVRTLTLLARIGKDKKDYSKITCYNCGGLGHTSAICKKSRNQDNHGALNGKAMLVIDTDAANLAGAYSVDPPRNKRMRLDFISNNSCERNVQEIPNMVKEPRTGKAKKSQNEKKHKNKKTKKKIYHCVGELGVCPKYPGITIATNHKGSFKNSAEKDR